VSALHEVRVPDMGDFKDVPVIEVLVRAGESIAKDAPLISVESEKATMEVPSPMAGMVAEVMVKVGDRVSRDSLLLRVATEDAGTRTAADRVPTKAAIARAEPVIAQRPLVEPVIAERVTADAVRVERVQECAVNPPAPVQPAGDQRDLPVRASPSLRRLARELGVDLQRVPASGPRGRMTREDVDGFVKRELERAATAATAAPQGGVANGPPRPTIDFSSFGPTERKTLSRIRRIAGTHLARSWSTIPHVTNFDEADVTELEVFRNQLNREQAKSGLKLTMLAFLIKGCVFALQKYPEFNTSLEGEELIYKGYFHIGFAADTPNGLVVPVIRDADRKGLLQIAGEAAQLAASAREGKLKATDMQGGCFSLSSLGGIGGTGFTPIINAPEVAILGVTKSQHRPVWDGSQFLPRLMLPLCLSWDHRVVDGVAAGRFLVYLAALLSDFRRALL
jgi:pyruvate dehydrogenase E2 component (dihydrolipoamide acetyltransferase)